MGDAATAPRGGEPVGAHRGGAVPALFSHAARGGHRHRQDQGALTKERIEKEGVVSDSLLLFQMVSRSRGLAVSRLFFYFLVGGVRVAAKTRQEGTGFKDEENTINP